MKVTQTISASRIYRDWPCCVQTWLKTVPPIAKQSDAADALRLEWVRLDRSPHDTVEAEAEEKALKKRMAEFLAKVPTRMMRGG